jgi:hypothetical protein
MWSPSERDTSFVIYNRWTGYVPNMTSWPPTLNCAKNGTELMDDR